MSYKIGLLTFSYSENSGSLLQAYALKTFIESNFLGYSVSIINYQISILLTPHGMLEPWIMSRNYWTKKLPAIVLYQRRAVQMCDCLIATSEEEKTHILDLGWNRQESRFEIKSKGTKPTKCSFKEFLTKVVQYAYQYC